MLFMHFMSRHTIRLINRTGPCQAQPEWSGGFGRRGPAGYLRPFATLQADSDCANMSSGDSRPLPDGWIEQWDSK